MKHISRLIILATVLLVAFPTRSGGDSDYEEPAESTHIPAMVLVTDEDVDDAIASLREKGVNVLYHRDNILLTLIPKDAMGNLRKARGPKNVSVYPSRYATPSLKTAREFNNASWINQGNGLAQPFDASGVVVGICDIGFDTRHPMFLSADGRECRIRRVVQYREEIGERTIYETPEEIYDWQTDEVENWHGTHTSGIAAGYHAESGLVSLAYGADIVLTGSRLSDVGLLAGVEDIIDYAKSVGKKAVINLSMGNYGGPHDGTSLFCRYLDLCSDDAIICISAGNEGNTTEFKSMTYKFDETNTSFCYRPADYTALDLRGVTEIWGEDDTPFSATFYWSCHDAGKTSLWPYPTIKGEPGSDLSWRISTDPEDPDYDPTFAAYSFDGTITASAGVSPLNGRFCISFEIVYKSETYSDRGPWALYWPAIKVEGRPGVRVDAFASGLFLRYENGSPVPDNQLNISDMATGHRTISVGMTCNTDVFAGATEGSGYKKGEICADSSFGTLHDGRALPITCAPGAKILSSISQAFVESHPDEVEEMKNDLVAYDEGRTHFVATYGTSMSCPFVAGAVATWLQAFPDLTPEQAIEIVQNTNTHDYPYPDDPRHGQGWFNAYEGLKEVINLATLTKIDNFEASPITLKYTGGELLIGNVSGENFIVEVYTSGGVKVMHHEILDNLSTISLRELPTGVYIATVRCGGFSTSVKCGV